MESFKHNCIKCGQVYTDNDVDAYYCEPCNEVRKQLAKEVDSKLATMPRRETKSELQAYEELRRANGGKFPSIQSMGIKL